MATACYVFYFSSLLHASAIFRNDSFSEKMVIKRSIGRWFVYVWSSGLIDSYLWLLPTRVWLHSQRCRGDYAARSSRKQTCIRRRKLCARCRWRRLPERCTCRRFLLKGRDWRFPSKTRSCQSRTWLWCWQQLLTSYDPFALELTASQMFVAMLQASRTCRQFRCL